MSPFTFDNYAGEFYVNSSGYLNDSGVDAIFWVRPAVSLKFGTKISKIGDGSVNSPFVVE